ncbi:YHYH protein [bacterium]|nr:YHYH protein [bacterium]
MSSRLHRPRARLLACSLAALAIVATGRVRADARESGFQATPAFDRLLVNKDVNGERWAMSWDRAGGVVTGNVFPVDGGAPKFVVCRVLGSDAQGGLTADCKGADACISCPCGGGWTSLGSVVLPSGFFEDCDGSGGAINASVLAACSGTGLHGNARATCDDTHLHLEATGVPDHAVMVGIRHWNGQYVVAQPYVGSNAFRIPLHPTVPSSPTPTSVGPLGVAVNGVPIFNPFAQNGVTDAVANGEMDVCGGHAGRADDYHYHAAPTCLMDDLPPGNPVGFAFDGFAIHGFTDPDGSTPSGVDECNGHVDARGEYHYNTVPGFPYMLGCFHGTFDPSLVPHTTGREPPPGTPVVGTITNYFEDAGGCLHVVLDDATDVPYCPPGSNPGATTRFQVEAWADNWFAMYSAGSLVLEDSVPITTERSFNAETGFFEATYPLELAFVLKDFKQDDTGLEYIGTPQQQMGDGGFVAQITDLSTGSVVAVSNSDWKCKVIHRAPLDPSCEKDPNPGATCLWQSEPEPVGWKDPAYDASGWQDATEWSANAVGPKDGYFTIAWDSRARFVWTSDLERDNTILCKVTIEAP